MRTTTFAILNLLFCVSCIASFDPPIVFDRNSSFPDNIDRNSYTNFIKDFFEKNYVPGFLVRTGLKRIVIENQPTASYSGISRAGGELAINLGTLLHNYRFDTFPDRLEDVPAQNARRVQPEPPSSCTNFVDPTSRLNCISRENAKRQQNFVPAPKISTLLKAVGEVLHHELMHEIDNSLDFRSDRELKRTWNDSNPDGFIYRNKGASYGISKQTDQPFWDIGFVSDYAQTNISEDIASTHAYFVTDTKNQLHRAASDPVLRKKFELVKRMLESICNKPLRKSRTNPDQSGNQSCAIPDAYRLIP